MKLKIVKLMDFMRGFLQKGLEILMAESINPWKSNKFLFLVVF
ncbi:hypothetical protein B4100_3871 [Heyndrickxia coagulans]|nr:hypothetical protein B4100_3871 [Heyndrickxia coagulans]